MSQRFRVDIQALRGLAVLLVLFYHAELLGLSAGYLGVDIFFVLSGYLMASLITRELREGTFSLGTFYFRRAKRLLPAAYVVFLATALFAFCLLTAIEYDSFCRQMLGAVTFTANFVLWQQSSYFSEAASLKPLLHTWSLSIEEQYYLFLPFLLLWLPRRHWRWVLCAALLASLALCLVYRLRSPTATFYALPTRAWELLLGSAGAVALGRDGQRSIPPWISWPCACSLLLIPVFSPLASGHPGPNALLICVATLVTILARLPWLNQGRICGTLARVGNMSYSLYLVHWPLFALANNVYSGGALPLSLRLGLGGCSLALGFALYRYVEAPFHYRSLSISAKPLAVLAAISILMAALPFAAQTRTEAGEDFAQLRRINQGFGPECDFVGRFTNPPACRSSDQPRILLWGDSFAMHLVPGVAQSTDLGVAQATSSSCGPFLDLAPLPGKGSPRQAHDCLEFNASVLRFLAQSPSVEVLALSSPFDQYLGEGARGLLIEDGVAVEKSLDAGVVVRAMSRTVEQVRALGKRVVVVSPPPRSDFNVGLCSERLASGKLLLGNHAGCQLPRADVRRYQSRVLEFLERLPVAAGVKVIRLDEWLCSDSTCATELDGVFLYRDASHLSHAGSVAVARKIGLVQRFLADAE